MKFKNNIEILVTIKILIKLIIGILVLAKIINDSNNLKSHTNF